MIVEVEVYTSQGRIHDFQIKGGGAKDYLSASHIPSPALSEVPYGRGPALEALGFSMLSQAIWALLCWSILETKLDIQS